MLSWRKVAGAAHLLGLAGARRALASDAAAAAAGSGVVERVAQGVVDGDRFMLSRCV